jgi:hypothetical protein
MQRQSRRPEQWQTRLTPFDAPSWTSLQSKRKTKRRSSREKIEIFAREHGPALTWALRRNRAWITGCIIDPSRKLRRPQQLALICIKQIGSHRPPLASRIPAVSVARGWKLPFVRGNQLPSPLMFSVKMRSGAAQERDSGQHDLTANPSRIYPVSDAHECAHSVRPK